MTYDMGRDWQPRASEGLIGPMQMKWKHLKVTH